MTAHEPTLESRLRHCWPPDQWSGVGLLVAVSGGADSVGLLRALVAVGDAGAGRLHAAHFNHGLRGADSDRDQTFVEQLCARLGIDLQVGRSSAPATSGELTGATEERLRDERYEFLKSTAEKLGTRFVAVAHTANDQAETILHHILRGTGLAGLSGMSRTRPLSEAVTLIRPLLEFERCEILQYLAALEQPFRTDASNDNRVFTRNRLRHDLLPLIESQFNPDVQNALRRLGRLAGDAQRLVDQQVEQLLDNSAALDGRHQVDIDCQTLGEASDHLVREMFIAIWRRQNWPRKSMGHLEWSRLGDMVRSAHATDTAAQIHLPGGILAQRDGHRLLLVNQRAD